MLTKGQLLWHNLPLMDLLSSSFGCREAFEGWKQQVQPCGRTGCGAGGAQWDSCRFSALGTMLLHYSVLRLCCPCRCAPGYRNF